MEEITADYIVPLSSAQYAAYAARVVPPPEMVDDKMWSLPMPMPGDLTYTLSTVHLGDRITVLDPGWATPDALGTLRSFLAGLGRSLDEVDTVLITHAHPDHIGLADQIREASGARILLHRREETSYNPAAFAVTMADELAMWGVPDATIAELAGQLHSAGQIAAPVHADGFLEHGEIVPGGSGWEAILTPGHTAGHLCFVDNEHRRIFTGDHVLPVVFPGIAAEPSSRGNPIALYLASLQRLAEYDDYDVHPGHGYNFRGLRQRREQSRAHVEKRAAEIANVVASATEPLNNYEVAGRVAWTGGWERLRTSLFLYSALRQIAAYRTLANHGRTTPR